MRLHIVKKISAIPVLDNMSFHRYVKNLVQGYGITTELAEKAVRIWALALDTEIEESDMKKDKPKKQDRVVSRDNKTEFVPIEADISDYEFDETAKGIRITKYIGFDEPEIIIPNVINGKNVYEVGNYAFQGCIGIEKIVVSEGIQILGNGTFKECDALRTVALPNSLRKIGSKETYNCPLDEYTKKPKPELFMAI